MLKFFNINFNKNKNKFLIKMKKKKKIIKNEIKFLMLAYGCRNNVALLNEFAANGLSILSFRNILLLTEYSL